MSLDSFLWSVFFASLVYSLVYSNKCIKVEYLVIKVFQIQIVPPSASKGQSLLTSRTAKPSAARTWWLKFLLESLLKAIIEILWPQQKFFGDIWYSCKTKLQPLSPLLSLTAKPSAAGPPRNQMVGGEQPRNVCIVSRTVCLELWGHLRQFQLPRYGLDWFYYRILVLPPL